MNTLKVAVLGYGRSGSSLHANAIETSQDFEMAAVCDIDPERRTQASERFDCPTYVKYEKMLDQEELDLISIVTRTDQHCEMTCRCLEAGHNVLVTKPWCVNEQEALHMWSVARETGQRLLPWLPARWGCVFRRVQEIIESGAIGDVFCVRRAVGGFASRDDWQTESQYGGGYLLNWGPHIIDTAVLAAGGQVHKVYGWMKQVIIPGDTEDVFFADIEMDDGTRVLAERTVAVESPPSWYVQGDHGTLIARDKEIKLYSGDPHMPGDPTDHGAMQNSEPEETREEVEGARWGDSVEIYGDVAADLRGEQPFPVTAEDAVELTIVMDAIRFSAKNSGVLVGAPALARKKRRNSLTIHSPPYHSGRPGREPPGRLYRIGY